MAFSTVFEITESDTLPKLQRILQDAAGTVRTLAPDDVVTFRMASVTRDFSPPISEAATVNDRETGDVQYDWPVGAPQAGLYRAEFHVDDGAGGIITYPGGGEYIQVLVALPAA